MDVANLINSRPHNATIALFGDVTEDNDRIALLQIRPGMREGEREALMLRKWGRGPECIAEGQPSFFTLREQAYSAANCWVDTGRRANLEFGL